MKAIYEFRLAERDAESILPPGLGRVSQSGKVRVVKVLREDPVFTQLEQAHTDRRRHNDEGLIYSWDVRRSYTADEISRAELLHLLPIGAFEPEGEECGTKYDESTACPHCGAGRQQLTPLALDARKVQPERDIETQTIPRHKDISRSIADEIAVSNRVAHLLTDASASGFALGPVNRCGTSQPLDGILQLMVTANPVEAVPPTSYGIDPFDLDEEGRFRCPFGHVAGLNLLSELTIDRATWYGEDIVPTRQWFGERVGALVPSRSLLISARVYRLMVAAGVRGARYEVVHAL